MALKIGGVFTSNNFGDFEIIEQIPETNNYRIKFFNTGSYAISSYESIRHGRVRDKFAPVVAGVGYTGTFEDVVTKPENVIFYRAWNDMLHRCYDINDKDFQYYGAMGVTVDPAWFDFGTYFNDIKEIPGYDKKLKYPNQYQLDKDYLQMHLPKWNRIYSKSTCLWLSKTDNYIIMNADNNSSGFAHVIKGIDGTYYIRINNRWYSQFDDAIAAANAVNNIYDMRKTLNKFMNLDKVNNVPYIPFKELVSHQLKRKEMITVIDKE